MRCFVGTPGPAPKTATHEIIMRGTPYQRVSRSSDPQGPANSYVSEALAIQAAKRPPKGPAKAMPITPTLPKVVRGRKRRRTV
jgi:hypothetical protein